MIVIIILFNLISIQNPIKENEISKKVVKVKKKLTSYVMRKPYIQNVNMTEVSILWETGGNEKCKVTLNSGNDNDKWEIESGPKKYHEVRFKGLVPGTKYKYSVTTQQGTITGTCKTAGATNEPFSFLVFGDNRHGHKFHQAIINNMALESVDFYINTGDLVNDGLIKSGWYRFFRIEHPLTKKIPLYPAVGNHENAFGKGLIYWRRYFALPQNGPQKEKVYFFTWGNSRFFFLNTNRPIVGSKQASWFKEQLQETAMDTKIKHIFVMVHQSPYTSGPHGPHKELVESGLVEEMRRYGVDIIFAGHDHIYERGRVNGLNYVVSGGGGAPVYYVKTHDVASLVTEATYHYCRINIKGDVIEYSAHRLDGSLLDFFVIKKKINVNSKPVFEIIKEHKVEKSKVKEVKKPVLKKEKTGEDLVYKKGTNRWLLLGILLAVFSVVGVLIWIKVRKN
jgi:predicted phosphodiesterase